MPRSRMGLFWLEAYPLHFGGLTAATSANCGCLGRTIFEWRDLRSRGSRIIIAAVLCVVDSVNGGNFVIVLNGAIFIFNIDKAAIAEQQ
ncbi:hypothetical protein CEXT_312141 [Caerostris extrusa]|uniref:Uncharacterized protein n=1 Tax=Caerostris extrusa TaxID=172846 RepID=A0AAV4T577_CAEEX|nr:hypothetical protein CEXT_312141 [Caerostris extrusa]